MIHLSKKGTFSSSQSHWHSQQKYICFVYFPSTLIEEKILPQRVPPQRRLAFSRLRVPNLDVFVTTAAGNFLSIGAPRHREDPEITRSHHTNQQKQRGKYLEKDLLFRVPGQRRHTNQQECRCICKKEGKNLLIRVPSPGTRKSTRWNHLHFDVFGAFISQKKVTFSSGRSHRHSDRNMIVLLIFYHID